MSYVSTVDFWLLYDKSNTFLQNLYPSFYYINWDRNPRFQRSIFGLKRSQKSVLLKLLATLTMRHFFGDFRTQCCIYFSFLQYLTYSLILVLIACGVYQMMISVLKMVVLTICGISYLIIVNTVSAYLFEYEDQILQQYE